MAHLFAIATLGEDYRLVGVADTDAEVAKKAARAFGVAAFTSLDEVVGAGDVDAVVLAVPPFLHAPMTLQALGAGLHVYCEKPLAPTAAEGRGLADAADRAGRVLQVGLQYRFLPAYVLAGQLIRAGAIGEVRRVSVTATTWFRPAHYFTARPWRARWATVGGGVLIHQTCHQLDGLISLVGCPTRVSAQVWRALHDVEVEDSATALLEWPGGIRGTLVASTAEPVGTNRTEIHGDGGSLVIEGFGLRRASFAGPASRLVAEGVDDLAVVPVEWTDLVIDGGQGMEFAAIAACHRDFVAAIAGDGRPRNHAWEANQAIDVANAAYLSALRGASVDVPVDDDAYAAAFADLCTGRVTIPGTGRGIGGGDRRTGGSRRSGNSSSGTTGGGTTGGGT
jgi:predicted dehydrogenase